MIKSNYQARFDSNNKLINNVANKGAKPNTELKMNRNGDYFDISICIHEEIYPLFNSYHIEKIKLMIENNFQDVISNIKLYGLESLHKKYDNNVFKFIVEEFYRVNEIYDKKLYYNDYDDTLMKKDSQLINRIRTQIHEPLNVSFHITNGGKLLPEDWIGKTFKNGYELHREIDKLESRMNHPPCTYLCIYTMELVKENIFNKWNEQINKNTNIFFNPDTYKFELKQNKSYNSDKLLYFEFDKCNIVFDESYIFSDKMEHKTGSVGYYVSLMQKAIRRMNQSCAIKAINKLVKFRPYNNPQMNFKLINPTRQMFYRLFITIIEDVGIFNNDIGLDLLDLILYVKIFELKPYKQIHEELLNKVIELVKRVSLTKRYIDFKDFKDFKNIKQNENNHFLNLILDDRILSGLYIASKNQYGMKGDFNMIKTLMLYKQNNIEPLKLAKLKNQKKSKTKDTIIKLVSIDQHTNPLILTELQNIYYNFTNEGNKINSLNDMSHDLWIKSSCYNIRKHDEDKFNSPYNDYLLFVQYNLHQNILKLTDKLNIKKIPKIQEYLEKKSKLQNQITKSYNDMINQKSTKTTEKTLPLNKRIYEQILFSSTKNYFYHNRTRVYPILTYDKIKFKVKDSIIDDTNEENIDEYNKILKTYNNTKPKTITISNQIKNKYNFISNQINNFDINKIINKDIYQIKPITKYFEKLLKDYLTNKFSPIDTYIIYITLKEIKSKEDIIIQNDLLKKIPITILNSLYSRITSAMDDKNNNTIILMSQIDRNGESKTEAIDEYNEGYLIRILDILCILYPCFIRLNQTTYKIIKPSNCYNYFSQEIEKIIIHDNSKNNLKPMKVKTQLWKHQLKTKENILNKMKNFNQRGFGDASSVGSGKTLTALSILETLDTNINNYLILLPNHNLYNTWIDEINKHVENINVSIQESNGKYNQIIKSSNSSSKSHIYLTCMSRNRDHPLMEPIAFVIIDECISVQNKNTKWTIQCYKDVVRSKYGVLMLSATFFKTRYDKLFYLLKMLDTGIVEKHEYLDTILNTAINANIIISKRKWFISEEKIKLDKKFYKKYNKIKSQELEHNTKYIELKNMINKVNWIEIIISNLNKLLEENKLIVYFSDSEREIKLLKEYNHPEICFYPDISKKICCVNIHKASHGVNNLIKYNTILTKPVSNDIEIQIKGRLDRGNNTHIDLYLRYLVISDTIMELDMIKKDIGNSFYKNHIEVLASLYEKYL